MKPTNYFLTRRTMVNLMGMAPLMGFAVGATATATPAHASTTSVSAANAAPLVVPELKNWTGTEGNYTLGGGARIVVDAAVLDIGQQLAAELKELTGLQLAVVQGSAATGDIELRLKPDFVHQTGGEKFAKEGYNLSATVNNLRIIGPSVTGVFYGTRTILQAFVLAPNRNTFPAGLADDWPDYHTRGFCLDVGRRFFTAEFVREYIMMMSWFKLNEFQIHLNDNEIFKPAGGWQAAYSGFRLKSESPQFAGLASADGSYTRQDWDAFEAVAKAHQVQLIPEIDVPAHSLSIIKWKPELGLNSSAGNIQSDHLDLTPAKAANTTAVIKTIFDEFIGWFKGPDVHFGADEYPKEYADGYRTFFNDMAAHVRSHGKHPRAWGSMKWMHGTADGYDRDVTINAWSDDWYTMPMAAQDGYKFINTNDRTLYVVPTANYYNGQNGLPNQTLYENWLPHSVASGQAAQPGQPQGAMFAVWNDLVDGTYTELEVHQLIKGSFAVIGQKTWRAQAPATNYTDFSRARNKLAGGPGLHHIYSLSQGAEATSSGIENDSFAAANATDGDKRTRWSANNVAQPWLQFDLGFGRTFSGVSLSWEAASAGAYYLEYSQDGTNWTRLLERSGMAAGARVDDLTFAAVTARHVRLTVTAKNMAPYLSLYDMEVRA